MRALVIEDRASFAPAVTKRLEAQGVPSRWLPHGRALALDGPTWASVELVLVDALDLGGQQDDPTRSRLASLDLLDVASDLPPADRPLLVVYSTAMHRSEIRLPLASHPLRPPLYDVTGLLESIPELVAGDTSRALSRPTDEDWSDLDPSLDHRTRLAEAHQRMRSHERAWRQVWDPDAPFDKAAQVWITRNVLPLLGLSSSRGYGIARSVMQRVAGLPYRL